MAALLQGPLDECAHTPTYAVGASAAKHQRKAQGLQMHWQADGLPTEGG